uniref:Bardet-Biedl syndrome 10 n=1 Tax=Gouania willdenowi TaxID=441366 RepID=A0A8C5DTD5_GOUWI
MSRDVRMTSWERLHLNNVFQTVCALESVVLRSFGPEGGHVLFTRDTGQALLTRNGTRILKALQLQHPVARMVVECVCKHSAATGDGSKTFVLLLASLLRTIQATTTCGEAGRALAERLLLFARQEFHHVIVGLLRLYGGTLVWWDDFVTPDTQESVQTLLVSFFSTRLSQVHSDFISDVTWKWIHGWSFTNTGPVPSLRFLNDHFSALHTTLAGFPVGATRLIEGQVIHRDFSTPCILMNQRLVKAVTVTSPLLRGASIVHYGAWMERSLRCVIANLQTLGVRVILSAVTQPPALLSAATQAGMCVVECISDHELSLFTHLTGTLPVTDCWKVEPQQHIALLSFCRPLQLGAHSLLICAPGEGQTDQYANAFRDAVRMLLTASTNASESCLQTNSPFSSPDSEAALEPGWLVTGGGTFEFILSCSLLQNAANVAHADVARLVAKAVLVVPRHILGPRHFLETQSRVASFLAKHSHGTSLAQSEQSLQDPKVNIHGCKTISESDVGVESVSCKYQLLLAVLQCLTGVLRVDTMLWTHIVSQPDASCEDDED